jgi:hypothetical protein
MRRANLFLSALGLGCSILTLTFLDSAARSRSASTALEPRARLAASLELTDLALFTEARYTRHPSQSDLHSAFQDYPMALDHFPSGSLVQPRWK